MFFSTFDRRVNLIQKFTSAAAVSILYTALLCRLFSELADYDMFLLLVLIPPLYYIELLME